MGIQGLLPFLRKASREAHLQDFKGQTAAVDAYCWLHKGAFSCADKLVRGEPTNGYVIYMMKQISLLLNNGIKPILVFDGCNLPSKAVTEKKRRENREKNRKKAKELLREGKTREAKECFQRCVDITSEMAADVINACHARNVDIIVAPYEADSQLAYLNQCGIAQLVLTEDSDLVLFGCKAVLFKMDNNGGCVLVEAEKLHLAMNVPRDKFCFSKFRNMCILSGCDYLPSLPGIGLGKACKFFNVTSNTDIHNVLCKVPAYLKMPHLEVTKEYRDNFIQAINTFLYQLVFDPITRRLRPLNDYPDDTGPDDYPYAGKFVGHDRALQIALGNINVQTGEIVGAFNPETYKPPKPKSSEWSKHGDVCAPHPSMWGNKRETRKIPAAPAIPSIQTQPRPATSGKEVTVTTPLFKRKKPDVPVPDNDITEGELQSLYSLPEKRMKTEPSPDDDNDIPDLSLEQVSSPISYEETNTVKTEGSTITNGYNSSPEEHKSRNPFAKSQSFGRSKTLSGSQFSALKKFSKLKKTVLDQNTIVQSRYFTSSTIKSPVGVKSEPTPDDLIPSSEKIKCEGQNVTSGSEEEKIGKGSDISHNSSSPESIESPLSQIDANSQQKRPQAFKWNKLSDKFSYSKHITVETSKATKYTFKCVSPQSSSHELKENSDISNRERYDTSLYSPSHSSQVSSTSDVCSLDNESFNLTPTSLPLTPADSQQTPDADRDASLIPAKPVLGQKPKKFGLHSQSKCRAPGLSKSSSKKKNGLGPKQLSLTEMFGFKKDEHKLQAGKPVL